MKIEQEPKYDVNEFGHIYNRATSEVIPDDEPVFIFRARDRLALATLTHYLISIESNTEHFRAVAGRCSDFAKFAQKHPERMKMPDTEQKP